MIEPAAPRSGDAVSTIVERLIAAGRTVAVAESLTGGAVLAELISVPGASMVVRGGVVAYDTALKHSLLGVDAEQLAAVGPVDAAVARSMAEGVREVAAVAGHPADWGVATTGVAGPDPQGAAPVGLVYVAVADAERTLVREHRFSGDRAAIRSQAVTAALALLADALDGRAA